MGIRWLELALLVLSLIVMLTLGQGEELVLRIHIQQTSFLPVEPIIVSVSLENRSTRKWLIPDGFSGNLFFNITLPDGKQADYIGVLISRRIPPTLVPIEPGAALWTEENLLDNYNKLDQPGTYVVTATLKTTWYQLKTPPEVFSGRLWSNTITFQILEPRGIDLEAFRLIMAKVEERAKNLSPIDRERAMRMFPFIFWLHPDLCERILKDFPKSTYAKYACFYLAKHYHDRVELSWHEVKCDREKMNRLMKRGFATYDYLIKAIELYQKVLTEYPKFSLSGQAQFGLARCYFLKGDIEAARREAEKTIRQYPESFASQEARKLLKEIEAEKPS